MSLQFVPGSGSVSSVSTVDGYGSGAPSAPALHDSLRDGGPRSVSQQLNGQHPLQARLEKWEEQQLDFRLGTYRQVYGAGEPIRRAMEMQIVKESSIEPMAVRGTATTSAHQDILANRTDAIDWEDVYRGPVANVDIHSELEKRMAL